MREDWIFKQKNLAYFLIILTHVSKITTKNISNFYPNIVIYKFSKSKRNIELHYITLHYITYAKVKSFVVYYYCNAIMHV